MFVAEISTNLDFLWILIFMSNNEETKNWRTFKSVETELFGQSRQLEDVLPSFCNAQHFHYLSKLGKIWSWEPFKKLSHGQFETFVDKKFSIFCNLTKKFWLSSLFKVLLGEKIIKRFEYGKYKLNSLSRDHTPA